MIFDLWDPHDMQQWDNYTEENCIIVKNVKERSVNIFCTSNVVYDQINRTVGWICLYILGVDMFYAAVHICTLISPQDNY